MRKVVVTGIGVVSPVGCGSEVVWDRISRGLTGIRALTDQGFLKLPCRIAGIVPPKSTDPQGGLSLNDTFTEAERRSSSKGTLYSLVAAEEAIRSSGLVKNSPNQEQLERIGVAVGMGMTDLQDILDTGATLADKGYSKVSPYFIPRILPNLAAGQISIKYGFQGANHCASTACATGAHAIGDAFNLIRSDVVDAMVCGGTESSINPLTIAAFAKLRALSTRFNDTPEKASRPFDKDRDGFVMAEGAGVLVLESLEYAQKRGAPILGEILGYGLSGDGYHLTAAREDGHGAFRAMQQALKTAKLSHEDISYVNCHATSTPIGDKAEIRALKKLFQSEDLGGIPISSTKGSHGHLLGAAGAVEMAIVLQGLQKNMVPPCANISEVSEEFKGINIVSPGCSNISRKDGQPIIAIKNSFGFGGTNASLCFSDKVL